LSKICTVHPLPFFKRSEQQAGLETCLICSASGFRPQPRPHECSAEMFYIPFQIAFFIGLFLASIYIDAVISNSMLQHRR
jgi:hypothetical protein